MLDAQQLADIMEPVWKVWPELRPLRLTFRDGYWWDADPEKVGYPCDRFATSLCTASMVEGLWDLGALLEFGKTLPIGGGKEVIYWVEVAIHSDAQTFYGPTKVEALASACIAFAQARTSTETTGAA